ncbi:hypothetical protein GCM10009744_59760 [Kribbella alba]|uniref:Secreted protein n=1 Tax=Kribbella alba TaxID=190197 RepID=A0ABN2FTD4_9ACTN
MHTKRSAWAAAVVLSVLLCASCGSTPQRAVAPAPAMTTASAPTPNGGRHGGRHGGGGPSDAAGRPQPAGLPTAWPADVSLPAGPIQYSTGGPGGWSVELLMNGTADEVTRSTADFYTAAGFTRESPTTFRRPPYKLVLATASRDHSATDTYLVVTVTTP